MPLVSRVSVRVLRFLAGGGCALALFGSAAHAAQKTNVQQNLVPPGWPQSISIPRIGVAATLENLPFNSSKYLSAPFKWNDVSWFDRGPRPGDPGRAIIFGHLDSTCCPAVFWNLHELAAGDTIQVKYRDGRVTTFHVMWSHTYTNAGIPASWIYQRSSQRGLVLFTCAGVFHTDGTGYDHKLMVYARLVLPTGKLG